MFSAAGFARAYAKSKLFENSGEQLAVVSSNSGGSWFLSQFAYSATFYEAVTTGDMDALIASWFKETGTFYKLDCKTVKCKTKYKAGTVYLNKLVGEILDRFEALGPKASKQAQDVLVGTLESYAGTAFNSKMNWAKMVTTWITTATPDIKITTLADPASRTGGMTHPTLHFQTAMAASGFVAGATKTTYLSASGDKALPMASIPFQWVVPGKQTSEAPGWLAESTNADATTSVVVEPDTTTAFYAQGADLPTAPNAVPVAVGTSSIWGGKTPPVTLITSSSSAAEAFLGSPTLLSTVNSSMSALMSYYEAQVTDDGTNSDRMSGLIGLLPDMALCSSDFDPATALPAACAAGDSRVIDGGYVDNLGLGQMIGATQKRFPGQRLRFILNDASAATVSAVNTISPSLYFNNGLYSGGAAPGGPTNLWWPDMTIALAQLFDTDWADVSAKLTPVPNSTTSFKPVQATATLTYTTVTTTTVDNAYYGCTAGTVVDLLIFELNNNLPMWDPYLPNSGVEDKTTELYTALANQCASPEVTAIVDKWLLDPTPAPPTPTPAPPPTPPPTQQPVPMAWINSGGGTRAMFGATGFARALHNGGILDDPNLEAVASNSGGSWFLGQFAFSESFYNSVITGNLDSLVQQWLQSAGEDFTFTCLDLKTVEKSSSIKKLKRAKLVPCQTQRDVVMTVLNIFEASHNISTDALEADTLDGAVSTLLQFWRTRLNWAEHIIQTLNTTTPDMAEAVASPSARVGGLQGPWLHFQQTVGASAFDAGSTICNYGSVGDSTTAPFSCLPQQTIIPSASSGQGTMRSAYQTIPSQMKLRPGFVYEPPNKALGKTIVATQQATIATQQDDQTVGQEIDPPKVTLLAAISSAAAGVTGNPMASLQGAKQMLSPNAYAAVLGAYSSLSVTGTIPKIPSLLLDFFKTAPDNGVCTAPVMANGVPETCTFPYQRLMDGGYVDNLALAQTVGTMQRRFPNQPLRLIIWSDSQEKGWSDPNSYGATYPVFANSPATTGVKPGETATFLCGITAPSPQAFDTNWVDVSKLYKKVGESAGNITYAELTTTTVENPAFGIQPGTTVNLLIFQSNAKAPMYLPAQGTGSILFPDAGLGNFEVKHYQALVQQASSPLISKLASEWATKTKYN